MLYVYYIILNSTNSVIIKHINVSPTIVFEISSWTFNDKYFKILKYFKIIIIAAMHAIINCLYLILNIDLASQLKSKIKETGDVPPSRTRQAIRPCVRHYKPRQILCHMTE